MMEPLLSSEPPLTSADDVPICSDTLCRACNKQFSRFWSGVYCKPITVIREGVFREAKAGCPICQLIAEFWDSSSHSQDDMDVRWVKKYPASCGWGLNLLRGYDFIADINFSADIPWGCDSQPNSMLEGAVEMDPFLQISEEQNLIRHSVKGNSGAPEVIQMLKSWNLYCRSNHSCSLKLEMCPLPTRIIDVGTTDGSDGIHIRTTRGEKGDYLTLSHCWGGQLGMKLLSSNLSDYEKVIDEQTLPATFRDAISVTRQLGFRYLWIDALCIIQDSHEDWEREVYKMASVYKNCQLMLSATDSKSSEGGLFVDRKDDVLFEISDELSIFGFPKGAYAHRLRSWYQKAAYMGALTQRGWALQESILAPRVIQFCSQQLFWECREVQISEEGDLTPIKAAQTFTSSRAQQIIPGSGDKSDPYRYEFWYNIITEFSHRNLTFPLDTLPAVTGLAQESAVVLDDIYINGLWQNNLREGILWEPHGNTRSSSARMHDARRTDQSAMRAPSWSWASVEGCVSWRGSNADIMRRGHQYLFEILGLEPPVDVSIYTASRSDLLIRGVIKKCVRLIEKEDIEECTRVIAMREYQEPSELDFQVWPRRVHMEVDISQLSCCYILKAAKSPDRRYFRCLIMECVQLERKIFRRVGICWADSALAGAFFSGAQSTDIRIC